MKSLGKCLLAALGVMLLCATCAISFATESTPSALVSSLEHETSLPIYDNRFVVDKNIQSLQIIINTDNVDTLKILGPAGVEVLPLQNSPGVNWQQIDKLYGVTLEKPAIGQWEIKGKMLAVPKVVIDTNLKMITPDFPNNLFRGETLPISAYLTDNNQRVTSATILKEAQFFATLHNVATLQKYKIFLSQDEKKPQGIFRYDYQLQSLPGVYRITIQAIGLLFQRQQEQQFYLYDYPATYTTKIIADTDELLVEVVLQTPMIDEGTCRFNALFMGKDGELSSTRLAKVAENKWQLLMPITDATHKMNLLLNAFTSDRRLVNITFPDVDVFAMYQQNVMDMNALWAQRWQLFWQQNKADQIGYLFWFSKEKLIEETLFLVNGDLPKEAIPLRQYRTYQQDLLRTWKPMLFDLKPIALAEKIKAEQAKQNTVPNKAAAQKVPAKAALQHKVLPPQPSPLRKWVMGALVVFIVLFIAMLVAIAWLFKPTKVLALYHGLQQGIQSLVMKLKALKPRLPTKNKPAEMPEPAAPAITAASATEKTPVAEEVTPAAVTPVPEEVTAVAEEVPPLTMPTSNQQPHA